MRMVAVLFAGLLALQGPAGEWRATSEEIRRTPKWMVEAANRPADTNEVAVADEPRGLKLFLLIGQSNMSGRGCVGAEDAKPMARCLKLNRHGKWVAASSPVHFDRASCGYGPANSFVRAYLAEHPEDTVGLVPCAVGGSLSVTWSPEDAPDPVGTNFRRALARARTAQKNGRVAGILWHQGESDIGFFAKDPDLKERYSERLAEMVRAFRVELGCPDAPFLVGEIGTLPKDRTRMNPILAEAVRRIPNAGLAKASDLTGHMPDNIHFDTPSYEVLGVRYYDAWKWLTGATSGTRGILDVLSGGDLSSFRCPMAEAGEIGLTFALTNGILVANAKRALVLESPRDCDFRDFVLAADVRYENEGFADSGIQFCVTHPNGGIVRSGIEYQLKTGAIGDGWALPGVSISRCGGQTASTNQEGYACLPRLKDSKWKAGVWHRVSVIKRGSHIQFFFDGEQVNEFVAEGLKDGKIGFQTKPYPEGCGSVSFRNVKLHDIGISSGKAK